MSRDAAPGEAQRWDAHAVWVPPDASPDYTVLLVFAGRVLDRFLLARHRERGWELPGGRVERGESLMAAARREWDEETGLGLHDLEALLLHRRPDGSRGHVFVGTTPDAPSAVAPRADAEEEEKIVAVRAVRRLAEVAPLAFPDDPYREVAERVWRTMPADWGRVAEEDEEGFVARLSLHPEAHPKGHEVVPHPARGRSVA